MRCIVGVLQSSHLSCLDGNDGALPLLRSAWTPQPRSYTPPADAADAAAGPGPVYTLPVLVWSSCVCGAGTCSLGSPFCAAASASRPPRWRDASLSLREVCGGEEWVMVSLKVPSDLLPGCFWNLYPKQLKTMMNECVLWDPHKLLCAVADSMSWPQVKV